MADLPIYILKVGICLAVFYLFFKLLLARETYHRLNRFLILSAIVLSFLLPVCVITFRQELVVSDAAPAVSGNLFPSSSADESADGRIILAVVGYLYIAGIAAALLRIGLEMLKMRKMLRKGERRELEGGMHLILMSEQTAPFSWDKYIVMSREDWEAGGTTILLHEQAHARLHHTWDILLTDILGAAQWFNPAMLLLRRELRDLHEYEADAAVLRSGIEPKDYQLLLIKKAVGGRWYSVANSFNHNNLKKRINMMLQKKSSGMARAKSLLVLPLLCTAVLAFAETEYVPVGNKDSETSRKVVALSQDTVRLRLNGNISVADGSHAVKINSLTVDKENDGKISSDKVVRIKDDIFGLPLKGSNVLYVLDGKVVKSIDNFDADKIKSITIIQDKDKMKEYGPEAEGKDAVITLTLKPYDYGNVLFVVDGKIVRSIDDIDNEKIESVTVIRYRKEIEKYGKAAEGKDGVIEVKLKSASK